MGENNTLLFHRRGVSGAGRQGDVKIDPDDNSPLTLSEERGSFVVEIIVFIYSHMRKQHCNAREMSGSVTNEEPCDQRGETVDTTKSGRQRTKIETTLITVVYVLTRENCTWRGGERTRERGDVEGENRI